VILAGQVTSGGVLSPLNVTVKLHLEVLLLESVAEQFTVVVPGGKENPEAGKQVTVALPELSLALAEKETTGH